MMIKPAAAPPTMVVYGIAPSDFFLSTLLSAGTLARDVVALATEVIPCRTGDSVESISATK